MKRKSYLRARPDLATDELLSVLLRGRCDDFHSLFETVQQNLRARESFGGGEEMLRLRVYEKLQILANQGLVKKCGKSYVPVTEALAQRAAEVKRAKEKLEEHKASAKQNALTRHCE